MNLKAAAFFDSSANFNNSFFFLKATQKHCTECKNADVLHNISSCKSASAENPILQHMCSSTVKKKKILIDISAHFLDRF